MMDGGSALLLSRSLAGGEWRAAARCRSWGRNNYFFGTGIGEWLITGTHNFKGIYIDLF